MWEESYLKGTSILIMWLLCHDSFLSFSTKWITVIYTQGPQNQDGTYLHVSLQLQQMVPVPREKSRSFMREIHITKAFLPCSKEGFLDWIVVCPNKVVVNGNVLELWCVAIWSQYGFWPPCGNHKLRVSCAFCHIQGSDKVTLFFCT